MKKMTKIFALVLALVMAVMTFASCSEDGNNEEEPSIVTESPAPTVEPTVEPTAEPTVAPTTEPTVAPTSGATSTPTRTSTPRRTCAVCTGSGDVRCIGCGGKGKIKNYRDGKTIYSNCSGCGGRGSRRCSGCGGKGYN